MKTCYKAFTRLNSGELTSYISDNPHRIIYPTTGEWTKPNIEGSKIFCFLGSKRVEDFLGASRHESDEIWKCAYKGEATLLKYRLSMIELENEHIVRRFFNDISGVDDWLFIAPTRTYGVDIIKLLERIS